MCVVSNIGDYYGDRWRPFVPQPVPQTWLSKTVEIHYPGEISREEFDTLKAEVEECKRLLKMAKEIDAATGQPDCDSDDKLAVLRKVAELVGVDLSDVLGPAKEAGSS